MGESVYTADVWIRPEDADHPKLNDYAESSLSASGQTLMSQSVARVGNGLARSWLFSKLESGHRR